MGMPSGISTAGKINFVDFLVSPSSLRPSVPVVVTETLPRRVFPGEFALVNVRAAGRSVKAGGRLVGARMNGNAPRLQQAPQKVAPRRWQQQEQTQGVGDEP